MKFEIKKYPILITIAIIALAGLFGALFFLKQLSNVFKTPARVIGLQSVPCQPASQVDLGYPYLFDDNDPASEFTTAGGKLYVTARYFTHGVLTPRKGLSAIYMGNINQPPTYDRQSGVVGNLIKEVDVPEKEYGEFQLPAGRYWLWSSSGGDIVIYSCDPNGVSDPKPVGQTMK